MKKRSLPATTAPEALPAPLAAPTLWGAFGLASDPFFQAELRADPSALYPVSLHVGRDAELRLLLRQLGGSPSTRVLVEGEAGLGKTSLANKLKAELAPHMLSHPEPVRITGDTGALGFTADVLRVILRIRTLLDLPAGDFWTTAARLVEGEDTVGAGFSLGPVGIQYQGGRIAAEAPSGSLHPVLEEALARTERDAGKPILVHVNNLENLAEPDALRAARLLRDVRDTLLLPGAHWLFVGAAGVEETVFRRYDQVGGIFPAAVVLDPLSAGEVAELLRRRYAHLSLGTTLVPPVEPEVAARLYSLYLGDLRNFLRLLGDACAVALGIDGVHPLPAERIIHAAAPRYLNAIRRRIGDPDTTHLLEIARERGGGEFFVAQAADATGLSQSDPDGALDLLARAGARRGGGREGERVPAAGETSGSGSAGAYHPCRAAAPGPRGGASKLALTVRRDAGMDAWPAALQLPPQSIAAHGHVQRVLTVPRRRAGHEPRIRPRGGGGHDGLHPGQGAGREHAAALIHRQHHRERLRPFHAHQRRPPRAAPAHGRRTPAPA